MPGFDGTGPRGLDPMTGGRRGFCRVYVPTPYPYYIPRPYLNYYVPPYVQTPFGATFAPTYSKEQERYMLEQQVQMLESQLESLRKRLEELSK